MADDVPATFHRKPVSQSDDFVTPQRFKPAGPNADEVVLRISTVGQLVVCHLGIEQHERRENSRILKQSEGAVHGRLRDIRAIGPHAFKEGVGIKEVIRLHDGRKHVGSFRCIPQ